MNSQPSQLTTPVSCRLNIACSDLTAIQDTSQDKYVNMYWKKVTSDHFTLNRNSIMIIAIL